MTPALLPATEARPNGLDPALPVQVVCPALERVQRSVFEYNFDLTLLRWGQLLGNGVDKRIVPAGVRPDVHAAAY